MSESDPPNKHGSTSVEAIEIVIKQMLAWLKNEYGRELLDKPVRTQLEKKEVREEFTRWLLQSSIKLTANPPWLEPLRSNDVDKAIEQGVAWDFLQVVVLAYLPGPQYFQGAYIHSEWRNPGSLKQMKSLFQVPHLGGTVGWINAHLLKDIKRPYVALNDAQLDLRGRVATSDLRLGNRSVLGFPVSISVGNIDLASVSGFVFFSHPVPGVFPQPLNGKYSEAYAHVRKVHESALASAIESYIFCHYSKSLLTTSGKNMERRRTPLLTLSDDDPTGFLASVLFESSPTCALSAECYVNEDFFLDSSVRHFTVASMYPEKWAPVFVQHLRKLGEFVEELNIHRQVPLVWYFRDDPHFAQSFYPAKSIRAEDLEKLTALLDQSRKDAQSPNVIRNAIDDFISLYGPPTDASGQADLVLPVYNEQENSRNSLGFFRISFNASTTSDAEKVSTAFQNLWRALTELHREVNSVVAPLIIALEEERYNLTTSHGEQQAQKTRSAEVQHVKLWMDAFDLISSWLARQVHQLSLRLTDSEELPRSNEEEDLIQFALENFTLRGNEKPGLEFKKCKEKLEDILKRPKTEITDFPLEITLASFWPRSKLPAINQIVQGVANGKSSAENEFANLLTADPSLLRMLAILAPMLKPNDLIDLGPSRVLHETGEWADVSFGVPASQDVIELTAERLSESDLTLSIKWEDVKHELHHIRITLDRGDRAAPTRNFGSHMISTVPRTVAHRLGKNALAGLKLHFCAEGLAMLQDEEFNQREYYDVLKFVDSTEPEKLKMRFNHLRRAMLYGTTETAVWRILPIKSQPPAFLAALCNPKINRLAVLAFRDFALANAGAFYIARKYDARQEATEDYSRNLYAVHHGYRAPIENLAIAVMETKHLLNKEEIFVNKEARLFVWQEMEKLHQMISSAERLARDAMIYAWRRSDDASLNPYEWSVLREGIETVIRALVPPLSPKVQFDKGNVDEDFQVDSSLVLWRHLLSKLIHNGIEYGKGDPEGATQFKVFIHPKVEAQRFVLEISNFVSPEKLDREINRVRAGLTQGYFGSQEEQTDNDGRDRGYGLVEAYQCCILLKINAEVNSDEKSSRLVISLSMARR